ncbi:hypothetical protein GCM10009526_01770 [Glutamicibacter creatinolyticus]
MANPRDSVAPPSPTEATNPVKLHEKFKAITDWISGLSIGGASVYDTEWQPIELASGFVVSAAQPAWAREGRVLHLRGGIAPSSGSFPSSGVKVGTLGFAPPAQHIGGGWGPWSVNGKVVLSPDGSLSVYGPADGSLTYIRLDGIVWKLTI